MKKYFLLPLALALVGAAGFFFTRHAKAGTKYIFVNQTADHRFDDSIRTTIFANQSRADVQNAVVIAENIPSGLDLETWAAQLFRDLQVGRATGGRGVLYVYVPSAKRLKIEVGYALEGVLPDVTVKNLEEAAKSFTYVDRMHDFWADLINTVNVSVYNQKNSVPEELYFIDFRYLSGGAGMTSGAYEFSAAQLAKEFKSLQAGDVRFAPKSSAHETMELYLTSLREGIGDSNLPLLSAGSRLYRMHSPMNMALLKRMWSMYSKASPYDLLIEDDLAIAKFKLDQPVLPVILFREKSGNWLVHEPYSFSIFNRFEDSMTIFQTQPVQNGLFRRVGLKSQIIHWGAPPYVAQPLAEQEFFARFKALEQDASGGGAAALFALGDFYLFEMWNYERAGELYAQSLALEPEASARLWRSLAPLQASGNVKGFLAAHERLVHLVPDDRRLKSNFEFFQKVLNFKPAEWQSEL